MKISKTLKTISSVFIVVALFIAVTNKTNATYTEEPDQGKVNSITLKNDGAKLSWSVNGYSDNGFKVVWSKNQKPTYPTRDGDKYHYFSEPEKRSDTIEAFSGDGKYYVRVCEYLGGKCGVYSNEVIVNLGEEKEEKACTMEYSPVCGKNGKTYSNKCMAEADGTQKAYYGECKDDEEVKEIKDSADKLANNQLTEILSELKSLRNLVKEQANQIKYLKTLMSDMSNVAQSMQNSINSFITYGVDENTKNLGEGERAAVLYSYKEAFGELPSDENDLADVIKIANGRWPSVTNEEAEDKAKEVFEKIYKREPDMNNEQDNAAVTIMAYGLRQKAENRNLNSETNGLKIFKNIFGRTPSSTQDWNILQAITYSGASR